MRRLVLACVVLGLLGSVSSAGVVIETEVKSSDAPGKPGSETFSAQGEMTRTDSRSTRGKEMSVIFRDQTMYFIDHDKKVCQKIDKQGVEQLSAQLGAMMKQLEGLPPQQREMMEKMMKGKMPGMKKPPERRVEAGGDDQVGDYACTVYTLYSDDEKVQEICMADASVGAEISEAMGAFHALAEFAKSLMEVAQDLPFGNMIEMPYQEIDEMDGFPVRTRIFDSKGVVVHESTLKSVTRRDVEADVFEIPKGYKVKSLAKELQKGR